MSKINIVVFLNNLDYQKIAEITIGLVAIIVFVYTFFKLREVEKIDAEFDAVPTKAKNPYVNNDQLTRLITNKREPILRKVELLKQKR